ncbi:hypothetical protein NQD34_010898 [Periophthalmus magnuspinnatus]|nr:hypothetical protein NQD34_010898 [Periophthalmus magnuspinnatus]
MLTLVLLCAVITSYGAQAWGTTGQPSCRYNCGAHFGSCSCSNSCQYYGNCCYDYRSYCIHPTPDATPDPTPHPPSDSTGPTHSDHYSCLYNCGYHLGVCSCSSSCQYYGTCCHDYHSYCDSASTPSQTTEQPSCRYNCGRNMGYCSCSSSCQYYGNCCNDYYNYCTYTTSFPRPTPDNPSCRYNCGYSFRNCSCSSSCEYNGNCCRDYYSFCYYHSTSSPGTNCGGSLSGSGSFSSPNYPYYYQDNSYCVWQIRASSDQNIYLTFTYLQLENCCSCDYIAVYDGPSVGSRFLGKVCNDSQSSFHSSSNYLTVLFRTDGSVVGRGFNAQFTSSLSSGLGRVDCSSDNMNIVISRSYLSSLGIDGHNLYLNDQYCRPHISYYNVVFNFPINTCGTVREFDHSRIVYTNALRAFSSSYGEITRQSLFRLNVSCRMEQDSVSQIIYEVKHHDNVSISGSGRFNTSMAFYTSSNFYYKVTQVPYLVGLNQNLYVQVSLRRGDSTLVVFLDTCVASPSPHDFHSRSYDLIRNGCRVDSTFYSYSSGTSPYARFRFRAFQFLRASDHVYIQCKVLICPASDYNSRCRRGCSRRVAREVETEHESETVVLGPIQRQKLEKWAKETQKKTKG